MMRAMDTTDALALADLDAISQAGLVASGELSATELLESAIVRLEATRELMRGFYAPILGPGKRRLKAGVNLETRNVMKSKRDMLRLRIPGRLLFLFRIRFGLYSVLARLGAELDWQALEIDLANQFHRFAPSADVTSS